MPVTLRLLLVRPMRIMVTLAIVLTGTASFAASPTEEETVVRAMSDAAQRNDLAAFLHTVDLPSISAGSKGECTPETVLAMGKIISMTPGVTLETRRRNDLRVVLASMRDGHKIAFFTLRPTNRTVEDPEGHLIIVGVDVRFPDTTP